MSCILVYADSSSDRFALSQPPEIILIEAGGEASLPVNS